MSTSNTPAKHIKKTSLSKVERERLSKDIASLILDACINSCRPKIEMQIREDLARKLYNPTKRDDIRKIGSGSRDSFYGGYEPNDQHREAAIQIVQSVSEIYERPMGPDGAFADDWNSLVGYFSRMLADRCGIKWFGRLVKEIDESPNEVEEDAKVEDPNQKDLNLSAPDGEPGSDSDGEVGDDQETENGDITAEDAERAAKEAEIIAEKERAAKIAQEEEAAEAEWIEAERLKMKKAEAERAAKEAEIIAEKERIAKIAQEEEAAEAERIKAERLKMEKAEAERAAKAPLDRENTEAREPQVDADLK